jgi:hypothetical protein
MTTENEIHEELARQTMNQFYRDGSLEVLIDLLKQAPFNKIPNEGNIDTALYYFAKAAKLVPEATQSYERLLGEATKSNKPYIQAILHLVKGEHVKTPPYDTQFPYQLEVIDRPISRPIDLDYLWCEFSLTGEPAPVEKIIGTLAWTDHFRVALNNWLVEPNNGFFQKRQKRKTLKLLYEAGLEFDEEGGNIVSQDDLDCLIIWGHNSQYLPDSERLPKILSALPFSLSDEDLNHMMIKASALWSLSVNCLEDPNVKRIYLDNEDSLPAGVHISFDAFGNLKRQEDSKHLDGDNHQLTETYDNLSDDELLILYAERDSLTSKAYEALESVLRKRFPEGQSDTTNIQTATPATGKTVLSGSTPHEMTGEISNNLQEISKLPDSGWTDTEIPEDFLGDVSNKVKSLNSFSTLEFIRTEGTATTTKNDGIDVSWRADFVRPDKVHVSQSMWNDDRDTYELDEWISLDDEVFVNAGLWMKTQDRENIERLTGINTRLSPETILADFVGLKIELSGLLNVDGTTYIFIQTILRDEQEAQTREQVWIDEKSKMILKHRLMYYENDVFFGEQVEAFIGHEKKLSISAPEWLNIDPDGIMISESVCVVEHW